MLVADGYVSLLEWIARGGGGGGGGGGGVSGKHGCHVCSCAIVLHACLLISRVLHNYTTYIFGGVLYEDGMLKRNEGENGTHKNEEKFAFFLATPITEILGSDILELTMKPYT